MAGVEHAHVSLNSDNVPIITGTRVKVWLVALDHIGRGWDTREIHRQYPHLSLAQIHSALAYYYDHKAEMDADIERREQNVEEMRAKHEPGPVSEKLRATGRLP